MQERRKQSRILFNREVCLTSPNYKELTAIAYDFTMRGIGVITFGELDSGDTIQVNFQILASGDDCREIELRGRVAYSNQTDEGYKSGISFY